MKRALIVGAGLYGATCAHLLRRAGWAVTVMERRDHIAGNCVDEVIRGQRVCRMGAHIFHTASARVWAFVQQFGEWTPVAHRKYARVNDRLYAFPISLMTLHQLWGVTTPDEAQAELNRRRSPQPLPTANLETWCLHTIGPELYETFVKGYTEKMWGRPCADLPHSIVARIPVRLTYDDRYFSDPYEAVPTQGYTALVAAMLEGCDVRLGVDYLRDGVRWAPDLTVYTGPIDALFGYEYGRLDYRSLAFRWRSQSGLGQGALTVNYPSATDPRLRTEEYRYLWPSDANEQPMCDTEPLAFDRPDQEALYPVRDAASLTRLARYQSLAHAAPRLVIGGRLGQYQYLNMDQTIAAALRAMEGIAP